MKTQPPSSARLSLREFIFSQLRVKLTFPYVLLAVVLAIVATFIATQIIARDIEERFNRNLADGGQLAGDALVTIERDQLALLRGIAHTEGLPGAVQSGNNQQVFTLAAPLTLNTQGELVDIVDVNGNVLMAMHHRAGSSRTDDYVTNETTRYQDWAIVRRVATGETDQGQDKFADLIQTPWGYALYTAGPIKVGEQLVGVVLVGSRAVTIVPRLAQASLKAVAVYLPNGQVLATTLTARDLAHANLSPDQYQDILQSSTTNTFVRPIAVGATANNYSEAFGIFEVRPNQALALFSVAGSREEYTANADNEIRLNMTLLFGLGLVTIIFIGILIANSIVRPVLSLVEASRKLSDGDFDARVKVNSPDEIGVLALAFNRMAEGLKEREFIKDLFGRVVSAEVRESLIESAREGGISLGGELRQVTMLFTDIRDFTSLSESYNPADVVAFLNEFFTAMLEVVNRFGGMVNKFGGDSTLVIFGAPVE